LTCAASNQNFSSRSICPSDSPTGGRKGTLRMTATVRVEPAGSQNALGPRAEGRRPPAGPISQSIRSGRSIRRRSSRRITSGPTARSQPPRRAPLVSCPRLASAYPQACLSIWGCARTTICAILPSRSMRANPAVVNGAPRSGSAMPRFKHIASVHFVLSCTTPALKCE
jgi:hypothetical protein